MQPSEFAPALISHLTTRILLCGGGGIDALTGGVVFMISPRVTFIECVISNGNTDQRPILHLRDESHASGHGTRLHLNCGDRNMSHLSLGLRAGSTALVALLGGKRLRPPTAARLTAPLRAMRGFTRDPSLTTTARCCDGRCRTALQISRLTAQWVERYLDELPEWADDVLQQWNAVLDLLEQGGAAATSAMLDWAILYGLFTQMLGEHGFRNGEELRPFNRKLAVAERALGNDDEWPHRHRIIGVGDVVTPVVRDALKHAGISTNDARRVLGLRAELAEMFTRYADLDESGLFRTLDRAGVLRHRFSRVDEAFIRHAEQHGPPDTRAGLRSALVREHGSSPDRAAYLVNWGRITDRGANRQLDQSDPFGVANDWRALPNETTPREVWGSGSPIVSIIRDELQEVAALYEIGHFDQAREVLDDCRPLLLEAMDADATSRFAAWDSRVWTRLGQPDAALRALTGSPRPEIADLAEVVKRVCIFRFAGLTPPPAIEPWLRRGRELLENGTPRPSEPERFLDHLGCTLLRRGEISEALAELERAARPPGRDLRIVARIHADLADALRLSGRTSEAATHLALAEQTQISRRFLGELAEFTLTIRGKVAASEGHRIEAVRLFEEAAAGLPPARSPVAYVRTQLLIARLRGAGLATTAIERIVGELRATRSGLGGCSLLGQILAHWNDWVHGAPPPFTHPDKQFWGL